MSRYLKYIIKNVEPLRIADDNTSQHGQTDTLRYLPGSSVRGFIINGLAGKPDFEVCKKTLFSGEVCFLNAYPGSKGQERIPSLKGFYEDKKEEKDGEKKSLNNVLVQDIEPGYKRASLGNFCYVEENCIHYETVETGEDLSINMGKPDEDDRAADRTVFRSQYIKKNHMFVGYITFQDTVGQDLIDSICEMFDQPLYFGNRRSAGYGRCICVDKRMEHGMPYQGIRAAETGSELYMALLSHTVMRNQWGELSGLYLEELAQKLGCKEITIRRCATSTVDVRGYNRKWHGTVPSAVMYQAGSVFCLHTSEPVSEKRMRLLEESGIGIRRSEGFGQIAFVKDFQKIKYKKKEDRAGQSSEPEGMAGGYGQKEDIDNDIRIAAAGFLKSKLEREMERYVVDHPLKLSGISRSKLGVLTAMCMEYQYAPFEAREKILAYAEHDLEKSGRQKKHGVRARQDAFSQYIHKILEGDLFEELELEPEFKNGGVMEISIGELLAEEDILKYKLRLMARQIRYENRREKNDW